MNKSCQEEGNKRVSHDAETNQDFYGENRYGDRSTLNFAPAYFNHKCNQSPRYESMKAVLKKVVLD
jgi:hypothetical protein